MGNVLLAVGLVDGSLVSSRGTGFDKSQVGQCFGGVHRGRRNAVKRDRFNWSQSTRVCIAIGTSSGAVSMEMAVLAINWRYLISGGEKVENRNRVAQ